MKPRQSDQVIVPPTYHSNYAQSFYFTIKNKAYPRCILAKKTDIKTLEEAWWSFVRLFLVKKQKENASLYRQY